MAKTHFSTAAGTNNVWATALASYGQPYAPTGNVLFVQSTNPAAVNDGDNGYSPDNPLATIDYAIGRCVADNEDVIVVLPGHVETVTAAAGVALDVAGVTIVGQGSGRQRAKVNFTTSTAASFDVTAARCKIKGLWFQNSIDAQTAMLNVQATDCTVEECEFVLADASTQAVVGILANGSGDRLVVQDCHLHGTADAGVTSAISCGACDDTVIRRNLIAGAHSTSGSIANSAAAVNFHVVDNVVLNQTADGNNKAIVLHSSTTGIVAGNKMAIIDSTSPAPVTAAAAWVAGNHYSSAVGVSASTLL